jgi:hypothetical protein
MSLRSPLGRVLGRGSAKEGVHRHSQLGVRDVIEDYVHADGLKTLALVLVDCTHLLIAAAAVFAVLKVALGGRV